MDQVGSTLWQNLRPGMSPDEVRESQPAAVANPAPDHLNNGATDDLIIPDFELNGRTFVAHLFFLDDSLVQVTLSLDAPSDLGPAKNLLAFLRSKYGAEITLDVSTDPIFSDRLSAEWLTEDGVNISLVCFQGVVPNLVYQTRNEASKI